MLKTTPLGYRADAAASCFGVSKSKFLTLVKQGRAPAPYKIDGCVIWRRVDLEKAFNRLTIGAGEASDRLDAHLGIN
jgi:predicted DNA-binding transcriptional regulator AlpA